MVDALAKAFFHGLAQSQTLKKAASRYGMRSPDSFARRFIAGETIEEAIAAARVLEQRGMTTTLDYLGESVSTFAEADAATRAYVSVMQKVIASGIARNISLKLTQLGLDLGRATAIDNLRRILEIADREDFFVRVDMEASAYTEFTLDIFETMWGLGYRNLGVVLQSALRRSDTDLQRVIRLGGRVRLVKGAYKEPKPVAYQSKTEVDESFLRLMRVLLVEGNYPAIATHDPVMIAATRAHAGERGIGPDRFEFQMLYGVRRDLQSSLTAGGFRMRVYTPFGREWFPYFMRRLGERPANVLFVMRSLTRER